LIVFPIVITFLGASVDGRVLFYILSVCGWFVGVEGSLLVVSFLFVFSIFARVCVCVGGWWVILIGSFSLLTRELVGLPE